MSRRETLCDRIMNEVTVYGGIPLRRADVYQGGYRGRFVADYFTFAFEAVDVKPWPIDQAREIMR